MQEITNRSSAAPEGWHTVTPRIVVQNAKDFVDFLKQVFGATGDYLNDRPSLIRSASAWWLRRELLDRLK